MPCIWQTPPCCTATHTYLFSPQECTSGFPGAIAINFVGVWLSSTALPLFCYSFLNSFRLRLQSHFLLRFSGWHFGSELFVQVSAKLCTNSMNHSSSHRPSGARFCAVCIAVLDEDYYTKESKTGCFSLFIAFFQFSHLWYWSPIQIRMQISKCIFIYLYLYTQLSINSFTGFGIVTLHSSSNLRPTP